MYIISILSVYSIQLPGMLRTSHSRARIHSIQTGNLLELDEIGKMRTNTMGTTEIHKMSTTDIHKMRTTGIYNMRTISLHIDAEFVT